MNDAAGAGNVAPRALRSDPLLRVCGRKAGRHDAEAERPGVGRRNLGQQNLNVERDAAGGEDLSGQRRGGSQRGVGSGN